VAGLIVNGRFTLCRGALLQVADLDERWPQLERVFNDAHPVFDDSQQIMLEEAGREHTKGLYVDELNDRNLAARSGRGAVSSAAGARVCRCRILCRRGGGGLTTSLRTITEAVNAAARATSPT
jgi:hypothetical protein